MVIIKKYQGFSLIELAIVLAILGIVFTAGLKGISSFKHSSYTKESEKNLVEIKQQVLKFGVINKYLPCPDSDGDGYEDRTTQTGSLGSVERCSDTVGGVPYLDLGFEKSDVDDGWGNSIRYAVNTDTTNANLICDKTSSASMFCNKGTSSNITWFNLDTPPTAIKKGVGNYIVCNKTASNCSASVPPSKIETDTAVVVLVAYNEDGATTIASMPSCSGIPSQNVENCNVDNLYHQREITVDKANFFDDVVTTISGYEVKSAVISKTISWNSYGPTGPTPSSLTPTYTNFDISSKEYNADQNQIETAGDDVVLVNRNVSQDLNLGKGNDYIAIGNNLTAGKTLKTGQGNDTAYIVGAASGNILLGSGDDKFVLGNNLTSELKAGKGNDKVWIQGNVNSGSTLNLGADNDVLWVGNTADSSTGNINKTINGGSGTDILVLENFASATEFWATSSPYQPANITNFEYIIFADDGSGNRQYCKWGGHGANACP